VVGGGLCCTMVLPVGSTVALLVGCSEVVAEIARSALARTTNCGDTITVRIGSRGPDL